MTKSIREKALALKKAGVSARHVTTRKHIKWYVRCNDGRERLVISAATSSDHRMLKNFVATAKRVKENCHA